MALSNGGDAEHGCGSGESGDDDLYGEDDDALGEESADGARANELQMLLAAAPTPAEAAALKGFRGDPALLPAEERFARALAHAPRLTAKILVALERRAFARDARDLARRVATITAACEEVQASQRLHRLLEVRLRPRRRCGSRSRLRSDSR